MKRDISSLRFISSSGVMWTREIKAGLLRHNPELTLVDGFASSEALGLGSSVMTRDQAVDVARFSLGPTCKVFTEDHREVAAGSGESGMVAVSGPLPVGYYKDEAKTAKTFPVIDGVRYSIPGDWVRVEADGTLTLLGRGSNCINTAGEKVYPEEVEEALKAHAVGRDALVVGIAGREMGSGDHRGRATGARDDARRNRTEGLRPHPHRRLQGAETDPREAGSGAGTERQGRLQAHPGIRGGAAAWPRS